jgi:protein-S-isoprenylcysteine O-methyltransferase Ste14
MAQPWNPQLMLQPQLPLQPRKLVLLIALALMVSQSLSHSMGILRFATKGLKGMTGVILNMKQCIAAGWWWLKKTMAEFLQLPVPQSQ